MGGLEVLTVSSNKRRASLFSRQWEGMYWAFKITHFHRITKALHQKRISYLQLTIVVGFITSSSQSRHLFRMSIRQPGINRSRSIRRSQRPSQRSADSKVCHSYFFFLKGIDRPFGEGVKSRLIRSLLINWRLGNFFSSPFKWISSQDQQKKPTDPA